MRNSGKRMALVPVLWLIDRKETANSVVISRGTKYPAQNRAHNWYPKDLRPVRKSIVLKPGHGCKQSRPKITRGINRIAMHAAESHPDYDYDQTNHQCPHI